MSDNYLFYDICLSVHVTHGASYLILRTLSYRLLSNLAIYDSSACMINYWLSFYSLGYVQLPIFLVYSGPTNIAIAELSSK